MRRLTLTLNLPQDIDDQQFISLWGKIYKEQRSIAPKYINDGPINENIHEGEDINL